jgi:16S rRNA U516 pseudouridylate synthase RsuA-like enzyme
MSEERLQKILARAGIASPWQAEESIRAVRVTVNGAVVMEMGSKADLKRDHIRVDGRLVHEPRKMVYLALHKPNNYVTP